MATLFLILILGYFLFLVLVSTLTISKNQDTKTYFNANKQSPWYLVAFGMIGASLSGITFISVPGEVGNTKLYLFQLILGFVVGYLIISYVLIPLYYRLKVTSIYQYLGIRFGPKSNKTGAGLFLVSQSLGASLRLFVVTSILHHYAFQHFGIPFIVVAALIVTIMWFYTRNGGIKTLVWTDTIQTALMLISLIWTLAVLYNLLDQSKLEVSSLLWKTWSEDVFIWDWSHPRNFYKQFLSGIFIAVVMTGLDQNLMQKHLTCKSTSDAQKNINSFSIVYLLINGLFLCLGILLYAYSSEIGFELETDLKGNFVNTDDLFPNLALNHLGASVAVLFILGIAAAALSSADSAITSLTTSFCFDFLKVGEKDDEYVKEAKERSHIFFSLLVLFMVIGFDLLKGDSAINLVFNIAGYTYGPILGLFAFGLAFTRKPPDQWIPYLCLAAPFISYGIKFIIELYSDYTVGFEFLLINGLTTIILLLIAESLQSRNELKTHIE